MDIPEGSTALRAFFVLLPVTLTALTVWGVYRAARRCGEPPGGAGRLAATIALIGSGWMAATWVLAASGALLRFDQTPPPFAVIPVAMLGLGICLARSSAGGMLARGLPLWALVGVQSFRLPLELMMDHAAAQGVMPIQMSFAGYNFDILTGITAAMLAITMAMRPVPRWVVFAWNVCGLVLLANIVVIAVISTPPIGAFGPDRFNVWVMMTPYVWLPAVMVLAAWAGHLLVFRALGERTPAQGLTRAVSPRA